MFFSANAAEKTMIADCRQSLRAPAPL